jgi:hypothetical protein
VRPAVADIRRYGRAFEKVSGSSKKIATTDREFEDTKRLFGAVMSGGKAGSAGKSIKRGRDADSVLSS